MSGPKVREVHIAGGGRCGVAHNDCWDSEEVDGGFPLSKGHFDPLADCVICGECLTRDDDEGGLKRVG